MAFREIPLWVFVGSAPILEHTMLSSAHSCLIEGLFVCGGSRCRSLTESNDSSLVELAVCNPRKTDQHFEVLNMCLVF